MTRQQLRAKLPPLVQMMERVTNKRVWDYYNRKYTDICCQLHSRFIKDYPLNKNA